MSKQLPGLMTRAEREACRRALGAYLAGESDDSPASIAAAESALDKLNRPDPAQALYRALREAFVFATDDEGDVWARSTIRKARAAIAKATGEAGA